MMSTMGSLVSAGFKEEIGNFAVCLADLNADYLTDTGSSVNIAMSVLNTLKLPIRNSF